ncbi:MAG: hypothetical protein OQK72_04950, partial [Gammaproteobacteria bacterium]|nr:hypothetical protein [Gammaproteobacteria bacterium]
INKTDNTIKRYKKNRYISEEIKNIKIALKLNADVIIIGKYRIADEIIYIEVNVYDIIKESNIINENIKSSIDIDIYQNIRVPAGKHRLTAWLNDDVKVEGPIYKLSQDVTLKPEQHLVIEFKPAISGFDVH